MNEKSNVIDFPMQLVEPFRDDATLFNQLVQDWFPIIEAKLKPLGKSSLEILEATENFVGSEFGSHYYQ